MVNLDLKSLRSAWKVMQGFVSKTVLILPDGIIAVGEINRHIVRTEIKWTNELPHGIEVESTGFTALVKKYDEISVDLSSSTFKTKDGEFGIITKQDKEGILAEAVKLDPTPETPQVNISAIIPVLTAMIDVLNTDTHRALLYVKGEVLGATDGKRIVFSKHPELKLWDSENIKALPAEMMLLAKKATSCLVSFNEESVIADLDGCRVIQGRVNEAECARGRAIMDAAWLERLTKGTVSFVVDSGVLRDAITFLSTFVQKSANDVTKIALTLDEDVIQLEAGRARKMIPAIAVPPELFKKRYSFNLDFLMSAIQHVDASTLAIAVNPQFGAGAAIFKGEDDQRSALVMMFKAVS